MAPKFALVLHGGAGTISRNVAADREGQYRSALHEALRLGYRSLERGESSLDVSQRVVEFLEDSPLFNAGKGSVLTDNGTFELEASIMDGLSLKFGAVAGLRTVKNPIRLAREVMKGSPWGFLGYEGAEAFADRLGPEVIPRVDQDYFKDPVRFEQWKSGSADKSEYVAPPPVPQGSTLGTVGCVALDMNGDLAAATSTGGRQHKWVGRIGDTPLIGAGNYASHLVAVSGTGNGEEFIRHSAAHAVHLRLKLMRSHGMTLQQAVADTLTELGRDQGGLIAVDPEGHVVALMNTSGMYRGLATSLGQGGSGSDSAKGYTGIWDELVEVDL